MPVEREVLPNRLEAREKFLRAFRGTKAAHAPLVFPRRLAAVLWPACSAESLPRRTRVYARQCWNSSLGRRITTQLIGNDLLRYRVRAQHTLEETFDVVLVAPLLQQSSAIDSPVRDNSNVRAAGGNHFVALRKEWQRDRCARKHLVSQGSLETSPLTCNFRNTDVISK
jgi:hypothetical protein